MPIFQTKFDSKIYAEQWFPDRPVMGVIQPHSASITQFAPYITVNHFFNGETRIPVRAGDWIVIAEEETFVVKDKEFRAIHQPVDDEAAIAFGFPSLADYSGARLEQSQ